MTPAARIRRSIRTTAPNECRVLDLPEGKRQLIVTGPDGTFAWPVRGNPQGPFKTATEAEQYLAEREEARAA